MTKHMTKRTTKHRALIGAIASVATLATPSFALAQDFKMACAALSQGFAGSGRIVTSEFVAAGGVQLAPPAPVGATGPAPDHCLVRGKINERTGIDGKPYAIGYELRLPATWNGKFVFQGGGGMDGVLRPALGVIGAAMSSPPNALSNGYAVASTDAGHLEEPGPLGPYLFGLDPKARQDKGYSSVPPVAEAGKAAIAKLYAKPAARAYFVGCSNGGRQAMMATQRYPELFDGVVAAAPAHRVPLAAMDAMGHNQAFLSVAPKGEDGKPDMGSAFSNDELKLVADAILEKCDALDGAKDGMVQSVTACKFDSSVLACKPGQNSACLPEAKVKALARIYDGTRNSKGERIYAAWPWDPGIAAPGWRFWRLGTPKTSPPNARNMTLIPGSIAYAFMSPPEPVQDLAAWVERFDFDRDPPKVMKEVGGFEPGISYETAASTDLDKFRARGGKIILTHGVADPIFSALDTIDYVDQLGKRYADAATFARLFLIPGMAHCGAGPSTDAFDSLAALDAWVDKGTAPDMMLAKARKTPDVPWPDRTRPLCVHPKVATYKGTGNLEDAASFECK
jgi:pimeloyl-ACP methyl ester carboxylesterase